MYIEYRSALDRLIVSQVSRCTLDLLCNVHLQEFLRGVGHNIRLRHGFVAQDEQGKY